MPGLVLDTTVLIDVLRGRPAVARLRLLQRERLPLLTTAVNVEEVARGLRESEAGAARGVTLHQADCLVAACAATIGAGLATGNPGDFPMPDLRVEVWPVGS